MKKTFKNISFIFIFIIICFFRDLSYGQYSEYLPLFDGCYTNRNRNWSFQDATYQGRNYDIETDEVFVRMPYFDEKNTLNFKTLKKDEMKALKNALNDSITKLLECMENADKEIKDKFNKGLKNKKFKIVFTEMGGHGGIVPYDLMYAPIVPIYINWKYLMNYTKGIPSPYWMLADWIPEPNNKSPLYSTIGHELLHLFTGITDSGFDGGANECTIYCLEKRCLDPNTIPPTEYHCENCQPNFCQPGGSSKCDKSKKDKVPKGIRKGDAPDDNYSYANGYMSSLLNLNSLLGLSGSLSDTPGDFSYSYYPDILVYNKFELDEIERLLNRSNADNFIDDYEQIDFSNNHKVLVIPSGELMGEKDSDLIKLALNRFVETGGTLLVLGQQDGADFDKLIPVPEGQSLRSYGWREDQSCYWGSIYFKGMHPVLSGQVGEKVSAGVDGYFSSYPADSTVLLRKIANQEPCLLYYPYGQGTVILTSLYTDSGLARSQATTDELKMVRDLITFAKNPNLPIPMFNLAENVTPTIDLTAMIKNSTETPATKMKIRVLTPDRTRVLFETEAALALAGGAETTFSINFNLPTLERKDYGICHTDYELYDEEGNIVQLATEADSGRFAIYQVITPYQEKREIVAWLTLASEEVYKDQTTRLTIHMRNNSDTVRTVQFYNWQKQNGRLLCSITANPGESVEQTIDYDMAWSLYSRIWVNTAETGVISKGVTLLSDTTKSTLSYFGPHDKKAGEPLSFEMNVLNTSKRDAEYRISVKLYQYFSGIGGGGVGIPVYETTQTIATGQTFSFNGNISGESLLLDNYYQLRMSVKNSDNYTQNYYSNHMRIVQSKVSVSNLNVEGVERNAANGLYYLQYGKNYPIKFKLNNAGFYDIHSGLCEVVVRSLNGGEVFKKVLNNIQLAPGEEKEIAEPFTFIPSREGRYEVLVRYSDETRSNAWLTQYRQNYIYQFTVNVNFDKSAYHYLDTAAAQINITAIESFHLKFTCSAAGFSEERDVTIPAGQSAAIETFQIPIGFPVSTEYKIDYEISGATGIIKKGYSCLHCVSPRIANKSETDLLGLRQGTPFNLKLFFTETSGVQLPFSAELDIQSTSLSFSDTRTVTILPGVANEFNYQIPVAETVPEGLHDITYKLKIQERQLVYRSITVNLPPIEMKFIEPPPNISVGEPFELKFENAGGRPGTFDVSVLISDENKKQVLAQQVMLTLAAGEQQSIALTLPDGLKSGKYTLSQHAIHVISGQTFNSIGAFAVSGQSLELSAYTQKEKYFDNEPITAQADLTAGANGAKGELRARIVRLSEKSVPVDEIIPGVYGRLNASWSEARGFNGKLNFVSGNPSTLKTYELATGIVTDLGIPCGSGYKFSKDGAFAYSIQSGYLTYPTKIFEINLATGVRQEITCPLDANYAGNVFRSSTGEYWFWRESWLYIFRRDASGAFHKYTWTPAFYSNNYYIYKVFENQVNGNNEIWIGTSQGPIKYSNGGIAKYFKSSYFYYRDLMVDKNGEVHFYYYVTSSGSHLDKYNGSAFVAESLPFTLTSNDSLTLFSLNDGSFWLFRFATQTLYRQQNGTWQERPLSAIDATVHDSWIMQNMVSSGEFWVKGLVTDPASGNDVQVLFRYSASTDQFELFTPAQCPYLKGSLTGITATNNPACFALDLGFLELRNGAFQYHELDLDKDRLLAAPYCLLADAQGKLYAGSTYGISIFDGDSWQNMVYASSGERINEIHSLARDTSGNIYAVSNYYGEGGILKLSGDQITRISFPEATAEWEFSLDYFANEPRKLAVDAQGRIWLLGNYLFYFDPGEGSWHNYSYQKFALTEGTIVADGSGGVWISEYNLKKMDGLDASGLVHIKPDLSYEEFAADNSGLHAGQWINSIFIDSRGTLWMINRNGVYLMSYDGQNWVEYSTFSGYPEGGIFDVGEDRSGNLVFNGIAEIGYFEPEIPQIDKAGAQENQIASVEDGWKSGFYRLDGDMFNTVFTLPGRIMGYPFENAAGDFYFRGTLDVSGGGAGIAAKPALNITAAIPDMYFENGNLHKISNDVFAGMYAKEVWRKNIPVDLSGGATDSIVMDIPAATTGTGNFLLQAEMISSLDQVLARSEHPFTVRESAVSTGLERLTGAGIFVRANADVSIRGQSLNNTQENKTSLTVMVKMTNPNGEETILREEGLSLNSGQEDEWTYLFIQGEIGTYTLRAELWEDDTLLSSSDLVLEVVDPAVTYEIIQPEYAGNEAFSFKIRVANEGKIPANVDVSVGAIPPGAEEPETYLLDENVSLQPGEERMLSFNDTIAADRDYDIMFSGDLETGEYRTVVYGYVGNLALTVLPQYREGTVTMGYTVANAGGLPFSDTLHFELFTAGNAVAVYSIDKTYNLYPGAEPLADALELSLAPGAYQLRWTSARSGMGNADFSILPSGIGQLAFAPAAKYPVGLTEFTYTLSNSDTVAGSIPLLIEIVPAAGGASIYSATRNYYINAGESVSDNFSFDFTVIGTYTARISGAKVVGGTVSAPFKVLNLDEVTTGVAVQPASGGAIPVQVDIGNSGYNDFAGTLVIEAGGLRHEEPLTVISEVTLNQAYNFDANGLSSGSQEVKAFLYDAAGNLLTQSVQTVNIMNADIRVIEAPQNLAIDAGAFADVILKVKNEGNRRGEAKITMTAFDTLNETRELVLEAGEEIELSDIYIDVDADIPAGRYPFNYTLSGLGVSNGLAKGNFSFQVNGIALEVTAALDRSLYNQGETAQLTINIASAAPVTTPLEVVVNWNDFSERRSFILDSGSSSQVFEIPLTEASAAKVFYGIYQEGGRGIYLNDIYLNFAGGVSVTLDQQVYAPGDSIHALFAVGEAGSLTAECFGSSQTVAIGSSASINFVVPANALGGSYGVSWTFIPSDVAHESASGSKAFDVSGLVVKVAKAELERGKYAPGDSIKAMLTLESNRDISLDLRSWTTTPEGQWSYLGEQGMTLSAAQQTPAVLEYPFATTEAGTHRFVYGLYREEQLVVSGAAAFDCGDAVLLGLTTDHFDYPNGDETVKVKVEYFGSGSASLKLYLDEMQVDERSITLSGLGSVTIDLTSTQIGGGRHDLRAVMSKDNLTSSKRTGFGYGGNLPDLAVELADRNNDGLNYTYTVRVSNSGKTAAAASALVFSDNAVDAQTAAIGALAPAAWQEVQFAWSGSGHAGSHALSFVVDRENAIKEYVEANNVYELTEEVPALFYKLTVDPQLWPANSNVSIFSRLINNTESNLVLQLHLTLTHNASSLNVLTRDKAISLSPFLTTLETDIFNTGTYPVGDYTLRQTASGSAGEFTEELAVIIEADKAISGTMSVTPTTVAAGSESQVSLQLVLHNSGNVALEDEPLTIKVTNNESQETVKTEPITVTLALGESKTMERDLNLNLAAGGYTISLEYLEQVVAQAELTAANGLDKDKYVSRRARALFMNLLAIPYASQKNYLKSVLSAGNILYQDTANIVESFLHYQKGEHNINVVFGKLPSANLQKEIKERVSRGEGLIYIVDSAANGGVLEELGGVNVRNVPAPQREKNITLLPGVLGSGGSAVLLANCKLMLEIASADVQVIGETKNGKKPLLAYHEYGNGKVLTICAPLEWSLGGNILSQLLLNAVNLFNREVFSASDLARVMPIELRIKNNTSEDKEFSVEEIIPPTAFGYGFDPAPRTGEGVLFGIPLAVGEEKVISYWLQLPDAIGTFDIKSEIYDGEQKIDEALLAFEVLQKVADRVVEIITEISAGGDTQATKALAPLNRIKNRSGDDALTLLLNLDDAIQAADLVGRSSLVEAALWRQQLQNVMMVYARKLYDKIKNFGQIELDAFGKQHKLFDPEGSESNLSVPLGDAQE